MNQQPQTWPETWRVLQLSDSHLFADTKEKLKHVETLASFAAVWQAALAEKPQLILLSGDLSQDDSPASYAHLAAFIEKSPVPVLITPGNHDQTPHFDALFQVATVQPTPCVHLGDWRIIALNSMQSGQIAGRLAPEILQFLHSCLKSGQPVLLVMHHPPFSVGSLWMDRYQLVNSEEFWQLLAGRPQVKLLLAGHVHQEFASEIHGVKVFTVPSTCTQFLPQSSQALLDQQLPGFRLVDLAADGRFTTQVKRVQPFISHIFSDQPLVAEVAAALGLTVQPLSQMPRPGRRLQLTDAPLATPEAINATAFTTIFTAALCPDQAEAAAFWQWLAAAAATPLAIDLALDLTGAAKRAAVASALRTLLTGVPAQTAL